MELVGKCRNSSSNFIACIAKGNNVVLYTYFPQCGQLCVRCAVNVCCLEVRTTRAAPSCA